MGADMKIVLQNLTKKFPGRGKKNAGEVTAVSGLTFEIPDGELVGLLGPSGCGKSTALNLISGLLKPTAGRIFFGEGLSLVSSAYRLVFAVLLIVPSGTAVAVVLQV